jgi:hypothetical protein
LNWFKDIELVVVVVGAPSDCCGWLETESCGAERRITDGENYQGSPSWGEWDREGLLLVPFLLAFNSLARTDKPTRTGRLSNRVVSQDSWKLAVHLRSVQ